MIPLKITLKEIRDALSKLLKRVWRWWSKNWFYTTLIAVAVIGGVCAFLVVPFAVPQPFSKDDSISTLRQAVLVATGGVLAILTLWENRRKNDQEHIRQVHAERRSRYATAIEQLADEKAPIRLGGVYTLVKLVDEWLADEKTLPNEEDRREEGQAIVNSLCAYIRSPFDLASKSEVLSQDKTPENYEGGNHQFVKDQAGFREEKELRLTILLEIAKRLGSSIITIQRKDGHLDRKDAQQVKEGPWSNFNYDFSHAHFFYSINFFNRYFGTAPKFVRTTFTTNARFLMTTFNGDAHFSGASFAGGAYFGGATFTGSAYFDGATFTGSANFSLTAFQEKPMFINTKPWDETYKARFSYKVNPEDYNFNVSSKSPYKIDTEPQELNGVTLRIPEGATLFDPDEPSEQEDNDGS